LHVEWEDGHSSRYEGAKLGFLLGREQLPARKLWDSSLDVVRQDYHELFAREGVQRFASRIHSLGFAIIRGVPLSKHTVGRVGELVGCKRPLSMYGNEWEMPGFPASSDTASSAEEILHRTDGCYLSQIPELQVLHCMQPGAASEGVCSLVDGFAVAADLRRRAPEAFACLTSGEVAYQFQDERRALFAKHPVIRLYGGEVASIAWNNYDRASLPADPAMVDALLQWDSSLGDHRWHLEFMLQKGDLLVMDNHRLLHAQKGALQPQSPRHHYGFYLDSSVHSAMRLPQPLGTASEAEVAVADLRSDTKTLPSTDMRAAMVAATLGDDVAAECPTTREFEEFAAELFGKEAALLVSSGTQGNLLAIAAQCERGSELIAGSESHIHTWEAGGPSVLFGVAQRTVGLDAAGRLPLADLEAVISLSDPGDDHCSPTRLVALENTNGARAGAALEPSYVAEVAGLCRSRGLRLHVDGARLGNAAAAWALRHKEHSLSAAFREQLVGVDTVSMCLSKGLGCPGGAVIAGDAETVRRCRRLRKLVGGSTRQAAGLLAAAGLHVLRDRDLLADLQEDQRRTQELVAAFQALTGVEVEYGGTNMAVVTLTGADAAARAELIWTQSEKAGVRLGGGYGKSSWRFVAHRDVSDEHVARIAQIFRHALG